MKKLLVLFCLAGFITVIGTGCGSDENKKPKPSTDNKAHGKGHDPKNMKAKKPAPNKKKAS